MAFFGSDGLENTNKQLTKQLASKNAELAFMKNERDTRARELGDARRTIEILEARSEGFEAERERWERTRDGKVPESSEKDLERIRKLEGEVKALRVENQQLASIKPSTAPAASRRRSTSLSSGSRIQELEAEVAALRMQSPSPEIDTLKTQLATAKRDQLKAENAQVALERSRKLELEALKSRLDDVTDELEFYRNDSGGGNGEAQRVKKEAEVERANLLARIDKLEQELKSRTSEIQRAAERLEQVEAELERAGTQEHPESTSVVVNLQAKLASLEEELAQARSATSATSSSSSSASSAPSSKSDRNLEKELRSKSRRIEDLEDENVELKEEIFNLKRTIPMPASPVSSPKLLRDDFEDRAAEHQAIVERLEAELADVRSQLEEHESEVQRMETVLQKRQSQTENLRNQRDAFAAEVELVKAALNEKHEAVRQAENNVAEAHARISTLQADLESAHSALLPAQQAAERAEAALADNQAELQTLTQQRNDFARALSTHTHSNEEFDAVGESLRMTQERMASVEREAQVTCEELQGKEREARDLCARLEQDLQSAQTELATKTREANHLASQQAAAAERIQSLTDQFGESQAEMHALQLRLEDKQAELAQLAASGDEMQHRLEESLAETHRLEEQIGGLQGTMADRSTESEARQRDEELFQLKEDLARWQSLLDAETKRYKAELETLEFAKVKDAEESAAHIAQLSENMAALQGRVEELQAKLQGTEQRLAQRVSAAKQSEAVKDVSATDIRRYMVKIEALRLERDEARHSLSFVQNEQRFALAAAKADRESAVDALRQAQADLRAKSGRLDALKAEHDETVVKLSELTGRLQSTEGSYAAASAEQHDLKDRIAQLELDMAHVGHERDELSQKVESLEQEPKHHDQRLLEVLNKSFVQEREHGKLIEEHATLKAHCAELESRIDCLQAIIDGKRPPTAESEREGDGVTTASAFREELDDLRAQLEESRKRVGRREGTIRSLHNENKKIKMNETLARAAVEDVTVTASLVKEDYRDLEQTWRDTVTALAVYHSDRRALLRRCTETRSLLRETSTALSVTRKEDALLRGENSRLESNQAPSTNTDTALASLRSDLQLSQERERSVRAELQHATIAAGELEAKLAASEITHSTRTTELRVQLEDSQHRAVAAEEQLRSTQHDLGDLLAKIASVEKQKAEATSLAETQLSRHKASIDKLEAQHAADQAKLSSLQSDYDDLLENLTASEEALGKLGGDHERELQDLAKTHEDRVRQSEATITELEALLSTESTEIETLSAQKATLEADLARASESAAAEAEQVISGLQTRLASTEATSAALLADRESLQRQLDEARVSNNKAAVDLAGMTARVAKMEKELEAASSQLTAAVTAANQHRGMNDKLRSELNDVSKDAKRFADLHQLGQGEIKALSSKLDVLKGELVSAQSAAEAASKATKAQHLDVARLIAENDRLKATLASASGSSPASRRPDLEDRIKGESTPHIHPLLPALLWTHATLTGAELEASLTLKNQEVDEADDRVRDMYKNNAKLEKKVAKLQRQLASASASAPAMTTSATTSTSAMTTNDKQTAMNTAANKAMTSTSTTATAMAPPPLPVPKAASAGTALAPVPPSPARLPLRAVNIFDTAQTPVPLAGTKRHREGGADEKPLPAECIMLAPSEKLPPSEKLLPPSEKLLPPSEKLLHSSEKLLHSSDKMVAVSASAPPGSAKKPFAHRSSFTPQRSSFNVFAAPAPRSTPRNIFATPSPLP